MTLEDLSRLETMHAAVHPAAPAEIYQWFPEMTKALREALVERDEARNDARLADCQLDEIVELVGSGGDGSAFGSVESLLCDLKERTEERDEARAEVERVTHNIVQTERHAQLVEKSLADSQAEVERLREAIRGALTNGHMNALCWATNDDECVGRCRVLRAALEMKP